jgi:hypothetical protein
VAVIAAGDSLWFLDPARAGSPHIRPAVPLEGEVRDLEIQINYRTPLQWRDARVGIATDRGLVLWEPYEGRMVTVPLGDLEAVESNDSLWVVLGRDGDGRFLRYGPSSHFDELIDLSTWTAPSPAASDARDLHLEQVTGSFLPEFGHEGLPREMLQSRKGTTLLVIPTASGRHLDLVSPPPYDVKTRIELPALPSDLPATAVVNGHAYGLDRGLAVLEMAGGFPRLRILGSSLDGSVLWEGASPFAVERAAGTGPQGREAYWILGSADSLALVKVGVPGRPEGAGMVIEEGGRALNGRLTALATDRIRFAAVAYAREGTTIVEILGAQEPGLPPLMSCVIRGSVRAVGVAPLVMF